MGPTFIRELEIRPQNATFHFDINDLSLNESTSRYLFGKTMCRKHCRTLEGLTVHCHNIA